MTGIQTISRDELARKIERGDPVQVVNVLDPQYYEMGMIKGSLKIPVDELDTRADELDRSREVIVYCASHECDASRKAAEKLSARGFDVKAYEGGIEEWKQGKMPVEAG